MIRDLPILAVTPGEPAGIGPEVLIRLARNHPRFRLLAVADIALLRQTADKLGTPVQIHEWQPGAPISAGRLACLHVALAEPAEAGRPTAQNATYVLDTLRQAVGLVRSGKAAALVTGPVNKAIINDSGQPFSGHTEFLAELSDTSEVVMMLAAPDIPGMRVALVTTHLPLRAVADAVTAERLEATLRITHHDLKHRFGIARPRMQVLGLNPHAGEGGHLGSEEDDIIRPTIEQCAAAGMDLVGPVPADTAFSPDRLASCDAVIAMYHDQGLPVLKHAGFGKAINITLGLPFIRTSVDHGTALDIAGQGKADESSLLQAATMAEQLAMQH